jgi:signal transduction histidine kinase
MYFAKGSFAAISGVATTYARVPYEALSQCLKGASVFLPEKARPAVITFLLLCFVFWADLQVPLGVAMGVPYVWVMLSSRWSPNYAVTIALAVLCSVLTGLGFLWSPPAAGEVWMVVCNRLLALFAIWLTTLLCLVRQRNELRLAQTHQMLVDNARLLHSILSGIREGVLVGNLQGEVLVSNPAALHVLSGLGNGHGKTIPDPLARLLQRTLAGERVESHEFKVEHGTGPQQAHYYRLNSMPLLNDEGRMTGGILTIHNETQHKRLERAIVEAAETEQRRIGQDIHDCLIQHLAGTLIMSQTLTAQLGQESHELRDLLQRIETHLSESVGLARQISHGLFPVELEQFGLIAALEQHLNHLAAGHDLKVEGCFEIEDDAITQALPPEIATHLYRIAQEALNNARRHAQGTRARLTLTLNRQTGLDLLIEDDGRGLVDTEAAHAGIGLSSMLYRAKQIGAELSYARGQLGGLCVACHLDFPLLRGPYADH